MKKTDEELKAEFIARQGVTKCEPADLRGNKEKELTDSLTASAAGNFHRGKKRPTAPESKWRRWEEENI